VHVYVHVCVVTTHKHTLIHTHTHTHTDYTNNVLEVNTTAQMQGERNFVASIIIFVNRVRDLGAG